MGQANSLQIANLTSCRSVYLCREQNREQEIITEIRHNNNASNYPYQLEQSVSHSPTIEFAVAQREIEIESEPSNANTSHSQHYHIPSSDPKFNQNATHFSDDRILGRRTQSNIETVN